MRVSDAKAQEMADAPLHCIYPPKMVNHVALDLLDARATIAAKDARIKELEAEAAKLSACWRDEELAHTITIDQRDQHEERLNDLFSALGMSERESQWSSANDPSEVAKERASELVTRIAALEAQFAEAKRVGAIEELERIEAWAYMEANYEDIASGDWRDGIARLCRNRAAALRGGKE